MYNTNITVGIPVYNARNTLRDTLFSIAIQTIQPKEILIVDDCSTESYDDILSLFDNIRYIRLDENVGVGIVRQHILKECRTKYLTMIDSDDIFLGALVLQTFQQMINDNHEPDLIITNMLQQTPDKGLNRICDFSWCHGKVYNTEYLKAYDLTFNPTRTHEEGTLNWTMRDIGCRYIICNTYDTYLWRYNKDSLTHQNINYLLTNYTDYIYGLYATYCNRVKFNSPVLLQRTISDTVLAHSYLEGLRCIYGDTDEIINHTDTLVDFIKETNVADWFLQYPESETIDLFGNNYSFADEYYTLKKLALDALDKRIYLKEDIFSFIRRLCL